MVFLEACTHVKFSIATQLALRVHTPNPVNYIGPGPLIHIINKIAFPDMVWCVQVISSILHIILILLFKIFFYETGNNT